MWQRSKIFPKDFFEYPSGFRTINVRKIKVYKIRIGHSPVFGYPVECWSEFAGIAFSFEDPRKEPKTFIHSVIGMAVKSKPEFMKEYEFWSNIRNRHPDIPQWILNDARKEDESEEDARIQARYDAQINDLRKGLGMPPLTAG